MKRISLYHDCNQCNGHGRVPKASGLPRSMLCPTCQGKGLLLTEEGETMIDFLKITKQDELIPEE